MHPIELLICRIFEQAIDDYRELREKNIIKGKDNASEYSIKDIEIFLKSKWCERLLEIIECDIKGMEIWQEINTQYT